MSAQPAVRQSLAVALILAVSIAVVNGFGRFAYALLLPPMRLELQWDYALSGWLNTANSLGYGAGAVLGMVLAWRFKPAALFTWGLGITVATLLACGFTQSLAWMLLWRFVSGVGSAWVFACGAALVASHYAQDPQRSGVAVGVLYAGGGIGIAASGLLAAPVLSGAWHWSGGWLALGALGALLALWPIAQARRIGGALSARSAGALMWRPMWRMLLAYFLFGTGYIVYLTFVVAWLRDMRLGVGASVAVWVFLGLAVVASGWVWRRPMARWWPGHTFAAASACVAFGTVLPLAHASVPVLLLSAALVGSFFMVPGSVMVFARQSLPQPQWAMGMNLFTAVFAAGQAAGPVVSGALADSLGWAAAMGFGALALLAGAALALAQPRSR